MSSRATVRQADINRAVRVARQHGLKQVVVRVGGAEIVLDLDKPELPAQVPVAGKRRIAL